MESSSLAYSKKHYQRTSLQQMMHWLLNSSSRELLSQHSNGTKPMTPGATLWYPGPSWSGGYPVVSATYFCNSIGSQAAKLEGSIWNANSIILSAVDQCLAKPFQTGILVADVEGTRGDLHADGTSISGPRQSPEQFR